MKTNNDPAQIVLRARDGWISENDIEICGEKWKGDNYDWAKRINAAIAERYVEKELAKKACFNLEFLLEKFNLQHECPNDSQLYGMCSICPHIKDIKQFLAELRAAIKGESHD